MVTVRKHFLERPDVLTVSIHADPTFFNPFVWGYAHERGAGPGLGANLNIPLLIGTRDDGYIQALGAAEKTIRAFAPGALVVALGLDASEHDPLAGLAVTTEGSGALGVPSRGWASNRFRAGRRIPVRDSRGKSDGSPRWI